jgi:Domain of unknown function (DUF4728)
VVFTFIVYDAIHLIVSILLVIGAVNSKADLLIPYIVCSVIGIVCTVCVSAVFFVLIKDWVRRVAIGCFFLINIPLQIVFCFVVGIFHRQLKAENYNAVV